MEGYEGGQGPTAARGAPEPPDLDPAVSPWQTRGWPLWGEQDSAPAILRRLVKKRRQESLGGGGVAGCKVWGVAGAARRPGEELQKPGAH